jgi:hypothetical protein
VLVTLQADGEHKWGDARVVVGFLLIHDGLQHGKCGDERCRRRRRQVQVLVQVQAPVAYAFNIPTSAQDSRVLAKY